MAWNGQPVGARQRQLLPPHGVPSVDSLPQASRARLPARYEAARKAISECARVDECKSWADKASALASYARQAKDESLRVMADRIRARAIRRCGELLKEVPSGQGSRNQHGELRDGAVTRQKAAQQAGLSERQKVTALRLASVPPPTFDALVESDSPPTVTQLAELGREPRPTESTTEFSFGRSSLHADPVRAARARKMFMGIREFCDQNAPAELASAFASQDRNELREFSEGFRSWLDEFAASLG